MEVLCVKNRGYKWTEHDGSYFRGYIQLYDDADTVLREREAIDYFASAGNFEEFTYPQGREILGGGRYCSKYAAVL